MTIFVKICVSARMYVNVYKALSLALSSRLVVCVWVGGGGGVMHDNICKGLCESKNVTMYVTVYEALSLAQSSRLGGGWVGGMHDKICKGLCESKNVTMYVTVYKALSLAQSSRLGGGVGREYTSDIPGLPLKLLQTEMHMHMNIQK